MIRRLAILKCRRVASDGTMKRLALAIVFSADDRMQRQKGVKTCDA
jgi:hypothetical protein